MDESTGSAPFYSVFRKTFHVPRSWATNRALAVLFDHTYLTCNAGDTFELVRSTLESQGYLEETHKMVHDYLHFMIMDLLDKEGVAYISEEEIKEHPPILDLLSRLTPDLIVQSSGERKTTIVDVYAGASETSVMAEKKSKYKTIGFKFDFIVVTPTNFTRKLAGLLSPASLAYLSDHFALFNTEYTYWRACVKLRGVIVNDVANRTITPIEARSSELEEQRGRFIASLSEFSRTVLAASGL